ncbi:MAG: HAMP domain-containing sensor histidine kinase [Rickettsiales bacterium]
MFRYFRLFSIVVFLAVVAFAIISSLVFRNNVTENIKFIASNNNTSIAKAYINSIWKRHDKAVKAFRNNLSEADKKDPEVSRLMKTFGRDSVRFFKDTSIVRANIYNSLGNLVLTSDVSSVTINSEQKSPDPNFIANRFNSGDVASQIVESAKFSDGTEGTIIQTMVPVTFISDDGKDVFLEGVIEIISDITDPFESLLEAQINEDIYLVCFFALYLILLFFMVQRAEAITARQHEVNIELTAAATAAQAENRDKSQFLANISHELRTPLNSIIGFSEIIKNSIDKGMEKERFEGYIHDIYSSGVHLLSLINDILDYSKAEAGKLEMEVAEVNLNKLVHNCVRLVTPRAEKAQVLLTEELPKEILNIATDGKKLKQILLNLLSNAIKFTEPGGEVKIISWVNVNDDSYMFEVRDSGIGIAPKDISKAMSPFGQVDGELSRKYEGTGLGLPLTKKFVELMGGKFEIESQVGVGTTIYFSIPRNGKREKEVDSVENVA